MAKLLRFEELIPLQALQVLDMVVMARGGQRRWKKVPGNRRSAPEQAAQARARLLVQEAGCHLR